MPRLYDKARNVDKQETENNNCQKYPAILRCDQLIRFPDQKNQNRPYNANQQYGSVPQLFEGAIQHISVTFSN